MQFKSTEAASKFKQATSLTCAAAQRKSQLGRILKQIQTPLTRSRFQDQKKKSVGPPGPETLDDAVAEGSLESEPLAVA